MACPTTSPTAVVDYLRQTSKGRLPYDPNVDLKDIQTLVENVIRRQNSLITSPPQRKAPELVPVKQQHTKDAANKAAKFQPTNLEDLAIASNLADFFEQNEVQSFNSSETTFALHLAEYDLERKRHVQATWAERKMEVDHFNAEVIRQEYEQLAALRTEKFLQAQEQLELEKAQREAVIEEVRQLEQNQRALHDQHRQRLDARIKEVEITHKKLEQQAAEKRQRDIQNQRNLDELVCHQKAITSIYSEISSTLAQCTHRELLPAAVKETLSKQKDVRAVMDRLISSVSQRAITSEDILLAKQQVQHVEGYLQVVRQGVELTNCLVESQKAAARTTTTAVSTAVTTAVTTSQADRAIPVVPSESIAAGFSFRSSAEGLPSASGSASMSTSFQGASEPQSSNITSTAEAATFVNEELYQCVSPEALRTYTRLQTNLVKHQHAYQQLLTETRPNVKKYKFDLQKAVNIPVNAISPLSGTHVRDKLERLKRLLLGQPVEVTEKKVSASEHPQAIFMCKDLLAKKFVKQGEEQVSSKHESAFAFAAVIIGLWTEMPDFGLLLLGHFHQKCPVTIPYYIPKEEGQSQEDHYRAMGYIYIDGTIEKQDKFLKRMSGMVRLYAAIICSPVPRSIRHPHPHGIENGWTWLTRILNLNPIPDLTATILYDFLETAGSCLLQTYGKQFQKLLVTLCKEMFPKIRQVTPSGSGGPVTRLENFLQKCLQSGKIPPPEGFLPSNFWYT